MRLGVGDGRQAPRQCGVHRYAWRGRCDLFDADLDDVTVNLIAAQREFARDGTEGPVQVAAAQLCGISCGLTADWTVRP